ncbi:phosphoribosylformylglycinamidine synthase subunit PurL [Pseudothermotoga thermarum]|uniref:Phosphoribosylformylglycinamidine synthase subunit PurL n=1 Tax=Pseudothermotoga thermarum DSM 5069 TaxID=688269 RepID=F7YWV9_9THEM|nr:phosphoribosylformylglycinamidine synthase subunit PurL [Pseudothermotoga thermarum]AEH50551.1 phosphoribosylformylglycinamidine synthase subunit II [Pseudothermotoga thermarum DSM 5069]
MLKYRELGLNDEEYKKICQDLGREPNDVELGMYSVTWSEHCSYKHSKPLLKLFPTSGKHVVQGPGENAGAVDIGDGLVVVFKMESHNHPSAVEPFQGAATGVGGIVRDVLAMGARPIALLDSLRFGDIRKPNVKYLFNGVVGGISFYGNCIGVPTVAGEIYFNSCYDDNPLVNVMCVGIARREELKFSRTGKTGARVLLVGALTGRDGIHGASFASQELDEESHSKRPSVQVGDPFMEKLLIEACLEACKVDGVLAVQDLGAAGLTSACSEVAAKSNKGIVIDLSKVPRREANMSTYEVVLSESQERMLLIVEEKALQKVKEIFEKWDLVFSEIGYLTDDGFFTVYEGSELVARVPVKSLTEGVPIVYIGPKERRLNVEEPNPPEPLNVQDIFIKLLSSENIASKRFVFEQYDHRVGINTVVLPGGDAAVLRIKGTNKGIAVSVDCNSLYCYVDPYEGGKIAVAEAARNVVVTGAKPLGITDCLNFANPDDPEVYWELKRCIEGMAEAAKVLEIPIVSGNVSLYNESLKNRIYPTPTVGIVGLIEDISKRCSADFKSENDLVVLLGFHSDRFTASEYLRLIHNVEIAPSPTLDLEFEKRLQKVCLLAIKEGLLSSAHDVSEGGLAIALAESSILGGFGVECDLFTNVRKDVVLFSETQSRIVVSLPEKNFERLKKLCETFKVPCTILGKIKGERFVIKINGNKVIDVPLDEIIDLYMNSLERKLNYEA